VAPGFIDTDMTRAMPEARRNVTVNDSSYWPVIWLFRALCVRSS